TGLDPVCPGSTNTYTAVTNGSSPTFSWSISGNGTISGSTTGSSVSVIAGALCGSPYALTVDITSGVCDSTDSKTVNVVDTTPPTITCPADKQLQCGASTTPSNTGTATATDNCGGGVTITHSDAVAPAGC